MLQIAVVGQGDQRVLMRYETNGGYHKFFPTDVPAFVKEDHRIRPEIWTDLGDLLDHVPAPRFMRRRFDSLIDQVARESIAVRYFNQVGSGFVELPYANIGAAWLSLRDHILQLAVRYNLDGQPEANPAGVAQLEGQLEGIGLSKLQARTLIGAGVATEKAGHASSFLRDYIVQYLMPHQEDPMGMVPYMLYAAWIGLELGSNTPLGGWYSGTDRTWVILGLTGVLIAVFLLRRRKK